SGSTGHWAIGANANPDDTTLVNAGGLYNSVLTIEEEFTDFSSGANVSGITNFIQLNPLAEVNSEVIGLNTQVEIAATNAQNFTDSIQGSRVVVTTKGSGTLGNLTGDFIGVATDSISSADLGAMSGSFIRVV